MEMVVGCIRKRLCLSVLMGLFVVTVCGCGPLTVDETVSSSLLSDDFSSYTGFPETPWSVIDGDSSSWTITSVADVSAARFYTTSSLYSCLLNSDFSDSGNVSVLARIKIVSAATAGGTYGLYLRAASDLTSYYELVLDGANGRTYICRVRNGLASVLNTVTWSVSSNMTSYHTYRFTLYENADSTVTLSAYVDGTSMITTTDSVPLTSGYYTGFFFNDILDGYISSYQITRP